MREALLTDRLILRDIVEDDAELLHELDSDPEVMRYIGSHPIQDISAYRERTRNVYIPFQLHPWHGVRMVFERSTGEFLGWAFIRPAPAARNAKEFGWADPTEVEVGYRYRRAAWGRGIATEAALALLQFALHDASVTAIVACASASNRGSLRVLEKLGLVKVGEVLLPDSAEPTIKLVRVPEQR